MEMTNIINYQEESIYTNWGFFIPDRHHPEDLEGIHKHEGKILDAYFFKYVNHYGSNPSGMEKLKFNLSKIKKGKMSLALLVESLGVAVMKIDGLEPIAQFLYENYSSAKNLSKLKGRKVTTYGVQRLEAIGVQKRQLEKNYLEKTIGKK